MKIYKTDNEQKPWCLDLRKMINGKKYSKRIFFKTKSEAQAEMEYMIKTGAIDELRKDRRNSNLLVRDVFYKYANEYSGKRKNRKKARNRPKTSRDKLSRYKNYLEPYFADMKLSKINKELLSDLSSYIQDLTHKNGEEISESIMYRIWIDVKSMLRYCYQRNILEEFIVPYEVDEIYKPEKSKPQAWSKKEYDLFMSKFDDDLHLAVFYTLGLCGLRKSELRGLKYKNVNFINSEIYIKTQLISDEEGDVDLKTKNSNRTIYAPNIVMEYIKRLKQEVIKSGVPESEIGELYVFTIGANKVIPPETLRRHYKKAVREAGIRNFPIHYLRHFFATQLLANGATVPYVQDQMGHSRSDTTVLSFYAAVTDSEKIRNVNLMNEIYKMEDRKDE